MHAFIYLFDAFSGLENVSCISLSSSVFLGRTCGEPGRDLPGPRDITAEQGGWFPSQEVQGETSVEGKKPLLQ